MAYTLEDGSEMIRRWKIEVKKKVNKTKEMDLNESIEGLIKQAERLNAGETSLAWDYNSTWQVKLVVKRKKKKVNK